MIFDCDYYNTPIATGVEDTEGFLNLPTMDMTDLTSVVIYLGPIPPLLLLTLTCPFCGGEHRRWEHLDIL